MKIFSPSEDSHYVENFSNNWITCNHGEHVELEDITSFYPFGTFYLGAQYLKLSGIENTKKTYF